MADAETVVAVGVIPPSGDIGYLSERFNWSADWDLFQRTHALASRFTVRRRWRAAFRVHGWHPSGWVGPDAVISILFSHGGHDAIVLTGEVPGGVDGLDGLVVTVRCDRRRARRLPLSAGPFRVVVPVGRRQRYPLRLRLRASGHFLPADEGLGVTPWPFSYRLQQIEFSQVTEVEHDGWYTDGWAGPEVQLVVPVAWESVRLRGRLGHGELSGQILTLRCGRKQRTVGIAEDDIDVSLPLPRTRGRRPPVITVSASKAIVPQELGVPDARRLAYRLDEVTPGETPSG